MTDGCSDQAAPVQLSEDTTRLMRIGPTGLQASGHLLLLVMINESLTKPAGLAALSHH